MQTCSRAIVLCAALAMGASAGQAQETHARDTLSAYRLRMLGVYDASSGTPIVGAHVSDVQTGAGAVTNASGLASLAFLPDGGGMVRIQKLGYTQVTRFIVISAADTAPVTEVLASSLVTLPTVTTRDSGRKYISPALNGFEQRRASGTGGRFISEADLRKHETEKLADVMRILPGAMLQRAPGNVFYFVSSRKFCNGPVFLSTKSCSSGTSDCYATIYLDGVLFYAATYDAPGSGPITPPPDVNKIVPVSDLAGVEYYASDDALPAKFMATPNGCGTVLLWTRER